MSNTLLLVVEKHDRNSNDNTHSTASFPAHTEYADFRQTNLDFWILMKDEMIKCR